MKIGFKGIEMARRHRINLITASFHYLVKTTPNEANPANPDEAPFTPDEFRKIVTRIESNNPLNDSDPVVIRRIKSGEDLPFRDHEIIEGWLHFGGFDGAYYGQKYRNNQLAKYPQIA